MSAYQLNQKWLSQLPFRQVKDCQPVAGGDINAAYQIKADQRTYFLKVQPHHPASYFNHEKRGLEVIGALVKTPTPLAQGQIQGDAYLVLEWLESGSGSQADLGRAVARMHAQHAKQFGFYENHTTRALVKNNAWNDSWRDFYLKQRLDPEITVAKKNGRWNDWRETHYQRMCQAFSDYYDQHQVIPSLLHGDLWAGNYMFDDTGQPVLIDPDAVYGDREFDLAMTTIFGGFEPAFYQAYQQEYPLAKGVNERLPWYQFYYLCMHLILFGETYGPAVDGILERY